MNWKRILLFSTVLGVLGGLLSGIGSLADDSGLEFSSGAILCVSSAAFVILGALQGRRPWLHALCVSILSYALGDGLGRLVAPELREPFGEWLGGLVVFLAIALAMTGAGVWLRMTLLSETPES